MQLLLRRDQVFTSTYVLAAGEPGFEISTNTFKVGDGTKTWAELPFANKEQIEVILENYYTKSEVDALVKAVDDKVAALNDTYATDTEVEGIRAALQGAIDTKLAAETFNTYSASRQLTDTEINTAIGNVDAKFASYRTSADQDVIDNGIKGRLDTLEAKPFDTYATKTEVQEVAGDLSDYETSNNTRVKAIEDEIDTFGDIVTHDATEFETAGAAAEAEGRINETLKSYYTKTEADAAFTTPAEVIAEVNKALSEVSSADTIESITTLVNYVNENAADLTGLITEVYGSAEMTGDSRLDTIEAKAAMSITADDITAWNAEKGVKAIVDANKTTWDKAGTALQAADLADYAKTADVVTNDEFTAFEAANTEVIGKKLDKTAFDAFNNGTSKDVAAIEADIVTKANAAQSAAEAKAAELDTALHNTISGEVATAKQEAIDAAKAYAATKEQGDKIDNLSNGIAYDSGFLNLTANEVTVNTTAFSYNGKEVATVDDVAAVDVGVTKITAGTDIVVTPAEGTGEVTVSHKEYNTGLLTKDPDQLDEGDAYVFTGLTLNNGHVESGSMKSIKDILEAMSFTIDGGTSAN